MFYVFRQFRFFFIGLIAAANTSESNLRRFGINNCRDDTSLQLPKFVLLGEIHVYCLASPRTKPYLTLIQPRD